MQTQDFSPTAARGLFHGLRRAFVTHPREAGETYFQHLVFTAGMAFRLVACSVTLLLHGIFPFLLTRTASGQIARFNDIMSERAARLPCHAANDANPAATESDERRAA